MQSTIINQSYVRQQRFDDSFVAAGRGKNQGSVAAFALGLNVRSLRNHNSTVAKAAVF
jgi:hypothetical protein